MITEKPLIQISDSAEKQWLGRGIVGGEYLFDLWMLSSGLLVTTNRGTNDVTRDPRGHSYWQKQEKGHGGDWHPVGAGE